ncbi:MAG: NAD-dependent epimerase/dehydratase family protein [Nitrospirae bacterium]|nr:NAD-dependent epimerase/dehydratase family protein [Nitrospirota bacterium]
MSLDQRHSFDGSRVLVVGGAGFVGSNLVKMVLASSPQVRITVVDNLLSSERVNVPEDRRVDFIEGSITGDGILGRLDDGYDYIFHLATYHGNQSSIHDPLADHENNTLTTLKLMNHVRDFRNIKKLVYSSAGCSAAEKTFDDAKPTTEEAPISLIQDSPYSISKIIGEFYSVYFHRQYKLPTVRARFQNVYGPGEILGAGKWRGTPATIWRNVTPTFIYKALKGTPLPVENNGMATRDFIYVDDICRGLIACALNGNPGDVYNIASGKETSIMELATVINEIVGNRAGIEYLPKRAWDNSGKRFGSTEKAKRELGFEASTSARDGLSKTTEWTRQNMPLIERCISKHKEHLPPVA